MSTTEATTGTSADQPNRQRSSHPADHIFAPDISSAERAAYIAALSPAAKTALDNFLDIIETEKHRNAPVPEKEAPGRRAMPLPVRMALGISGRLAENEQLDLDPRYDWEHVYMAAVHDIAEFLESYISK